MTNRDAGNCPMLVKEVEPRNPLENVLDIGEICTESSGLLDWNRMASSEGMFMPQPIDVLRPVVVKSKFGWLCANIDRSLREPSCFRFVQPT